MASIPPLRYLAAADVDAAMPPLEDRLELAHRVMTALATPGAADLPAKIGVHPRAAGAFAHAMPALLRGKSVEGDLLGAKWVAGASANRAAGLPAISALVVLNDAATGIPVAILDGAPITAERTAAVSGAAIRHFAAGRRDGVAGRAPIVAIIGAGVQGHSHVPVIGHVLPGAELLIHDRHLDRAEALADHARTVPGIAGATARPNARDAAADADVVVTAASFTDPARRQVLTPDWLADDALLVAVDYATMCSAETAREAALFVVDDRPQFLANRSAGQFDGYPDPAATIGEALLRPIERPARGRVVVSHLGVGLADVVFGSAILERATSAGLGVELSR